VRRVDGNPHYRPYRLHVRVTGRKDDAHQYQRIMDVGVALALPVCAHPL